MRTANEKLSSAEILELVDEEIQSNLFPALMSVRDDYAARQQTVALAANVSNYRLPFNANSDTILQVEWVKFTNAGAVAIGELRRIQIGELGGFANYTGTQPSCFAVVDGAIEVRPVPTSAMASEYVLSVHYESRPSRLCAVTACARIGSAVVATSGGLDFVDITVTSPSPFSTSGLSTGATVDIVAGTPPLSALMLNGQINDTTNDPVIRIFPSYTPNEATRIAAQIMAGAYLCPAGQTCVFPMPEAWWSIALAYGTMAVAAAMGNDALAAKYSAIGDAKKEAVLHAQINRVRKQPLPAFNINSPMRASRRYRNWGST